MCFFYVLSTKHLSCVCIVSPVEDHHRLSQLRRARQTTRNEGAATAPMSQLTLVSASRATPGSNPKLPLSVTCNLLLVSVVRVRMPDELGQIIDKPQVASSLLESHHDLADATVKEHHFF